MSQPFTQEIGEDYKTGLPTLIGVVQRFMVLLAFMVFLPSSSYGLESILVSEEDLVLDISNLIDRVDTLNDRIQVSTAPGADGLVRRIEVKSRETKSDVPWAVFALTNTTNKQIDRLLVAEHHILVGSGILWPDLGSSRIVSITPSQGFRPDSQPAENADIFQITLDPGATVTFVAELKTPNLPKLFLWDPAAYKDKLSNFTLFQGIVLGISGMLALLLTTSFVVRGTIIFPAAAAFSWAVLGYLSIDFGFWQKIFQVNPVHVLNYRAGAETALAGTLFLFLLAYLNLRRWNINFFPVLIFWMVLMGGLAFLAIYQPPVASGVARLFLVLIGGLGGLFIFYQAIRYYDRAVMLVPTWLMLLVWLFGAGCIVLGYLDNNYAAPALSGGLVVIVLLISFTVLQYAFSGGATMRTKETDIGLKALALSGSGDGFWNWDINRDRIQTGHEVERSLGLPLNYLSDQREPWINKLHPNDRERFQSALTAAVEQRGGRIELDARLRQEDGHFVWIRVKARPVIGNDGEIFRCVGTLSDVSEYRNAQERLLHDAVHDNLTSLPNRELFLDRLQTSITSILSRESNARPTLFLIDLDRFRDVNDSFGLSAGDNVLLTIARRLARNLKPQDSLARLAGDQYAIILLSETDPKKIAAFAEEIRKAVKTPVTYDSREIFLTGSIGIAMYDGTVEKASDFLKESEVALHQAKIQGPDKIEAFNKSMLSAREGKLALGNDLRHAVERKEIVIFYQPIIRLQDFTVSGFEALMRWQHPEHGLLPADEFIPIAEESELIEKLGLYVLDETAQQLHQWQQKFGEQKHIFASVNMSSRQLLRPDLFGEVKTVLARSRVQPRTLKIELTESMLMHNPEYSAAVLTRIRELGAGLSLDDFGTGYSSLSYLEKLPFDTIKIDKSFVQINDRGLRPTLLRAIVTMAHDLGMEVVAEGAESNDDAHDLYDLGCEYAQGFYFGAPMNAEEATKLLSEGTDVEF